MNRSCAFLFGLLMLLATASAGTPNLPTENRDEPYERAYYTGTLGSSPIQLSRRLAAEANHKRKVTGHYYSTPGAAPISLHGTLQGNNLTLAESTKNKAPAAALHGQFSLTTGELTLLWTSPDRGRKLNVHLKKISRQIKESTSVHDIPFTSVNPYLIEAIPLNEAVNADLNKEIHEYRANFAKLVAEILNGESGKNLTWYGTWHAQITLYSPELVSILVYHDAFVGGFHPDDGRLGLTYLQREGQAHRLKLADLFDPKAPWLKHVSDYCAKDLKRQEAFSFQKDGRTNLEASELQKFTISPHGLTIYFDPYEVGCYAEGAYAVTIPWKKLRPVLCDSPPLKALAAPPPHRQNQIKRAP